MPMCGWDGAASQSSPGGLLAGNVIFFSFPVKQFSEHFPWNILTLKFKIFAAHMQGIEREEPKLAAGNCVCQQRCQRCQRGCQVTVGRGSDASLCHHIEVLRAVSLQPLSSMGFAPLFLGQLSA